MGYERYQRDRDNLVERSTVDMPEAPDGIAIMGCDAANMGDRLQSRLPQGHVVLQLAKQ